MRAMITGGAGFLGSHLANTLVTAGHAVTVLDDLSAGDRSALAPGVAFTQGDVGDVPRLWSLLSDVDVVFHLAARVSISESVIYPVPYDRVNAGGTVSLMTAVRDAGVKRIVLVSSGTVYGEQSEQPISEEARPHPQNPYAVSKLAAEGYVRAIGDLYRIETVILRVFNAYGPGQAIPPAHPPVIPSFAQRLLGGGSLVLHGSPPGAQTRDFVYVDDVVDAMVRAGRRPGLSGHTLNIGSGGETSLLALVAALERVTGRGARTVASPDHSGGVARMCADVARAREALGWRPTVDLDAGLSRLIEDLSVGAQLPNPEKAT